MTPVGARVLPGIVGLERTAIFRQAGRSSPADDETISWDDYLRVGVVQLLRRLPQLSSDQVQLVAENWRDSVSGMGEGLLVHGDSVADPLLILAAADVMYATWTRAPGWLDLSTGNWADTPSPVRISTAYHLRTLFLDWVAELREEHNGGRTVAVAGQGVPGSQ